LRDHDDIAAWLRHTAIQYDLAGHKDAATDLLDVSRYCEGMEEFDPLAKAKADVMDGLCGEYDCDDGGGLGLYIKELGAKVDLLGTVLELLGVENPFTHDDEEERAKIVSAVTLLAERSNKAMRLAQQIVNAAKELDL
jgi:hypothetical protein